MGWVVCVCVCVWAYICVCARTHTHMCETSCIKNYIRNKCVGELENAYNMLVVIGKGKRPLGIGRCT